MTKTPQTETRYFDVTDDELMTIIKMMPEILDASDNIMTRYKQILFIQLHRNIIDDRTLDNKTMC